MAVNEEIKTGTKNLTDICSDSLILVLQLRAGKEYGDPKKLRNRVLGMLDDFEKDCVDARIEPQKIQRTKFAIVAFLDETILSSEWSQKADWLVEPLQLKLFNSFNAGEEFFRYLEELKTRMRENSDVLEVYSLCMSLGFRGKYQLQSPESVRGIIEELNYELKKYKSKTPEKLSPNGYLQDEFVKAVKEGIPVWVVVVIAAFIGIAIYIILSMIISSEADTLVNEIGKIIRS